MKLYDTQAILEDTNKLEAEAQAIIATARDEDRELDETEAARFEEITNEESGLLAINRKRLKVSQKADELAEKQARQAVAADPPQPGAGADRVSPDNRQRVNVCYPRNRLKVFTGENGVWQAYVFGQWLRASTAQDRDDREKARKWLKDNGFQNAVTTTTTVPEEVAQRLLEFRETAGASRQLAEVINMSGEFLRVPKMTAGQTVQYPGKGGAITDTDPTFAQVDLQAEKRAVLTQLANETQADSVVNMADRIASRAAFQLAYREDEEFVVGDGSAGFGGVTGLESSATATVDVGTPTTKVAYFGGFPACSMIGTVDAIAIQQSEHVYFKEDSLGIRALSRYDIQIHEPTGLCALNWDTSTAITLAHLHAMVGAIPDKFSAMGKQWLMSRQFFALHVQPLLYAAGGNTVNTVAGSTPDQVFGYPVYFSDAVPTGS